MVTFKFLCRIVLPKFYPGLSCESYHKGVYTLMWEYLHECVGDSFFLEKYLTLFPDAIYTDFGVILWYMWPHKLWFLWWYIWGNFYWYLFDMELFGKYVMMYFRQGAMWDVCWIGESILTVNFLWYCGLLVCIGIIVITFQIVFSNQYSR